jgi:hypothetical protein
MSDEELRREIRRLYADLDNLQGQLEVARRVLELNKAFFSAALSASTYDLARHTVGAFMGNEVLSDSLERIDEAFLYMQRRQSQVHSSPTEREALNRNQSRILDATLKKGDGGEGEMYEIDWRQDDD